MRMIRPFLLLLIAAVVGAAEFRGWERLAVVPLEDAAPRLLLAEVTGDERDDLVLINRRQSRLEICSMDLPPEAIADSGARAGSLVVDAGTGGDLNRLGLPDGFHRRLVPLDELPTTAVDLGGGRLLVFTDDPFACRILARTDDGWRSLARRRLLSGTWTGTAPLVHRGAAGTTCLVPCAEGVQLLPLTLDGEEPTISEPTWMRPRERLGRAGWWCVDLDGDGEEDVVEWLHGETGGLRWYPTHAGGLRPPRRLAHGWFPACTVLPRDGGALIATLDGGNDQVVRIQALRATAERPFGRLRTLALPASPAAWCGVRIGDRDALVTVSPEAARLTCHPVVDGDWGTSVTYPCVEGVADLVPVPARPGLVLLRRRGGGNLAAMRWEGGRFTFPRPWQPNPDEAEAPAGDVIELHHAVGRTWWVRRAEEALTLWIWEPDADAPRPVAFPGDAADVQDARWLGDRRLLVKRRYRQDAELWEAAATGVVRRGADEIAPLKDCLLDEYRLVVTADGLRPGRFSSGVLQWLDEDLAVTDQVMLGDDQGLIDAIATADGGFHALQDDGRTLHRMEVDDGGVARSAERFELPEGRRLRRDPHLGLIVVGSDRLHRVGPGADPALEPLLAVSARDVAPSNLNDPAVHRLFAVAVEDPGRTDLVLADDTRHRLTVVALDERDGALSARLRSSWPVFDDRSYPYGAMQYPQQGAQVVQPVALASGEVDGEPRIDLALICHDRCLFYLGEGESE